MDEKRERERENLGIVPPPSFFHPASGVLGIGGWENSFIN